MCLSLGLERRGDVQTRDGWIGMREKARCCFRGEESSRWLRDTPKEADSCPVISCNWSDVQMIREVRYRGKKSSTKRNIPSCRVLGSVSVEKVEVRRRYFRASSPYSNLGTSIRGSRAI